MSAELSRAVAVILVAAISAAVLRTLGSQLVPAVVCLGAVLALSLFTDSLYKSLDGVLSLSALSSASYYLDGAVRVIGVGYISSICKGGCEALGEATLGRAAALVGRIEIIAISFPYFIEIFKMGVDMIS